MSVPTEDELKVAIAQALRRAVTDLFGAYSSHHFYYCSLVTTGEALPPSLVAWSSEALAEEVAKAKDASAEYFLKWSYADSPFYCYGEQYFEDVRRLFAQRPTPTLDEPARWEAEVETRLRAMESAVAQIDAEGVFGTGSRRNGILLNVEVMPPDATNTARARRLNPPEALVAWLAEAAES